MRLTARTPEVPGRERTRRCPVVRCEPPAMVNESASELGFDQGDLHVRVTLRSGPSRPGT
jgi:hypothetical protein